MKGKMKTRKNAWMLSIIASLLVTAFAIAPAFGQVTTVLSAPIIVDETSGRGSTVKIDLTITDVVNLWGYQFILSFDPEMLTPTKFGSYPPWAYREPSEIGDDYVAISYHCPYDPPIPPFTGTKAMAWIEFTVNAIGGSVLDIHDSILTDPDGNPIAHEVNDGSFANIAVTREAKLRRSIASHQDWNEAKYFRNDLKAKVQNIGKVGFPVYVEFQITDETGMWTYTYKTDAVTLRKKQQYDFIWSISRGELIAFYGGTGEDGEYYVRVKCVWYDIDIDAWVTARHTQKFHFTLCVK